MTALKLRLEAADVTRWALVAGYLLVLALNLPGHLSVDPVLSLYEGRFHERITWGPPFHAWVLGVFDALLAGTSLYVVATSLMLFGGWMWLVRMSGRVSWFAVAAAIAVVLTPNVLVYQGIVWKDVFFANTATLGFICLIGASRAWAEGRRPLIALGGAALLFAMASLVRQNGLVAWLPAAAVIAWALRDKGWRTAASWAGGWLVLVALIAQTLSVSAIPGESDNKAISRGVRIVQHYDLAGAIAHDPTLPLSHIDAANPKADDILRARAGQRWSPDRVDWLGADPVVGRTLWKLPDETVRAEWLDLIREHPGTYLQVRLADFQWVFATPIIDRCLPVHVGVTGPPERMAALKLAERRDPRDDQLYNYTTWFLDTPVMSHVAYGLLALMVAGALLVRRRPEDIPVIALQVAALGFTASFLVISIACDYRYLYFLDVAALTGLLYLSLDPTGWRRSARSA
ncbi:hypothetical protein [Phenylobacterium sp. J367]|uniref:hypothetical protein n=1 Tax=Phenylobacterium sp. J367 TaxID=2898435 RepID=UPI002151B61C|nr:hypothetical protein [Phenylobacterium sp. J367]MCR5877547.1 hypothetical protein [Phenylobacterium sp. J367]